MAVSLSAESLQPGELPAALAEPYLQQSLLLNVDGGLLDLTAELNYDPAEGLTSVGEMQLTELQASDIETNQPLMSTSSESNPMAEPMSS